MLSQLLEFFEGDSASRKDRRACGANVAGQSPRQWKLNLMRFAGTVVSSPGNRAEE